MNVSRGDIVLADFPHATGKQSSRRPVLIVTLYEERIGRKIGELSAQGMQRIDDCLKAALGIP